MLPMKPNRRDVLKSIGCGIAASLLNAGQALACKALFSCPAPDIADKSNPSFDIFYRLSQWVTCREELDLDIARKFYDVLQNEPWGKEHISRTYLKIREAAETRKGETNVPQLMQDKTLDETETWFVSHLLTTYYLGVYYHEEREDTRLFYEEALMHDAIEGLAPIRLSGSTPFGEWNGKPPGVTE